MELDTITYQGREITVARIGEFSDGGVDVLGRERSFVQNLYRDQAGRYYATVSSHNRWTKDEPFESVHRLSLRGAILWAISLTGYDGLALRLDAKACLEEGAAWEAAEKRGWRGAFGGTESNLATASFSLCAAAPEAIDEQEATARHGDAVPIRDVLLDLADEWRIKAAEARGSARDLTPFCASHKLEGQADLLEQCAAALEAALGRD